MTGFPGHRLGDGDADAAFARLREGVAVFKLDPESLKYLVLQPNGPLAALGHDAAAYATGSWVAHTPEQ